MLILDGAGLEGEGVCVWRGGDFGWGGRGGVCVVGWGEGNGGRCEQNILPAR